MTELAGFLGMTVGAAIDPPLFLWCAITGVLAALIDSRKLAFLAAVGGGAAATLLVQAAAVADAWQVGEDPSFFEFLHVRIAAAAFVVTVAFGITRLVRKIRLD